VRVCDDTLARIVCTLKAVSCPDRRIAGPPDLAAECAGQRLQDEN
jgi:hypothetical protein